ncbi:unnamed protein product [Lampetra planeri]
MSLGVRARAAAVVVGERQEGRSCQPSSQPVSERLPGRDRSSAPGLERGKGQGPAARAEVLSATGGVVEPRV